jgi:glucose-1-phosphate adenylyltransferase
LINSPAGLPCLLVYALNAPTDAGTRLFPLTKERAKPAVPLAGKYRLVDIPIGNCLNNARRKYMSLLASARSANS